MLHEYHAFAECFEPALNHITILLATLPRLSRGVLEAGMNDVVDLELLLNKRLTKTRRGLDVCSRARRLFHVPIK